MLLKNKIDKLSDKIFIKKINLSKELIYKDLNELIIVKFEPIFVKNFLTDLNDVPNIEWVDLLKSHKDYPNKEIRNEIKDKMNEVNEKTSSNNNLVINNENMNNDVQIIEEFNKVNEESKTKSININQSQDNYLTLISKILPELLEREEKKRKNLKANNSSKPSNKSNIFEEVDKNFQDDITLSEEDVPNNFTKPSMDIKMLEKDEQLSGIK
jgi:hypothetical protein